MAYCPCHCPFALSFAGAVEAAVEADLEAAEAREGLENDAKSDGESEEESEEEPEDEGGSGEEEAVAEMEEFFFRASSILAPQSKELTKADAFALRCRCSLSLSLLSFDTINQMPPTIFRFSASSFPSFFPSP